MRLLFTLLATASALIPLKGLWTSSCPSPLEFDQEALNKTRCFLQRRTSGFPETRFRASTERFATHVQCRVAGLQPSHAYTVWNVFQNADLEAIGFPQRAAYGFSDEAGDAVFATEGFNSEVVDPEAADGDDPILISEEQWDAFRIYLYIVDLGPKNETIDQFSEPACEPLPEGEECPAAGSDGFCVKTLSGSFYQETCANRCGFIGAQRGGVRSIEEEPAQEEAQTKQFFAGARFGFRGIRLPQRARRDDVPDCGCDRGCARANNCCVDVEEECPNIRILPKRARVTPFGERCKGSVFRTGPSPLCPEIPPRSPGFYKDCILCEEDES